LPVEVQLRISSGQAFCMTQLDTPTTNPIPARWLIVADDLTGAADAAASFRKHGSRTLLLLKPEAINDGWTILAVDINVREVEDSPDAMQGVVERALSPLGNGRSVYLKIDSMMRGPIKSLIEEMRSNLQRFLTSTDRRPVLVCPAFPAQGRITRGGVQWVRPSPGSPPAAERAVLSFAGEWFPPQSATLLTPSELSKPIRSHRTGDLPDAIIPDAETDSDLEGIVEAGQRLSPLFWVGSAGLAAALGLRHPSHDPVPERPKVDRVIIVSGTAHPKAHAQIDSLEGHLQDRYAVEAPVSVFQAPRSEPVTLKMEVAEELARQARSHPGSLSTGWILTGGATARHFLEGCGVISLEVGGEVAPGVPWMIPREGEIQGAPIITKSGGFGEDDTLIRCVEFLLDRDGPTGRKLDSPPGSKE
jgi:uncharacterized protein YgbK (DUF1537 family)